MKCEMCGSNSNINYGSAYVDLCEKCASLDNGEKLIKSMPASQTNNRCECGNIVSPNAPKCPSCKKINPKSSKQKFNCRICGELLITDQHYYRSGVHTISSGNSSFHATMSHYPCPKCGEPKPYPFEKIVIHPHYIGKYFGVCLLIITLFWLYNSLREDSVSPYDNHKFQNMVSEIEKNNSGFLNSQHFLFAGIINRDTVVDLYNCYDKSGEAPKYKFSEFPIRMKAKRGELVLVHKVNNTNLSVTLPHVGGEISPDNEREACSGELVSIEFEPFSTYSEDFHSAVYPEPEWSTKKYIKKD